MRYASGNPILADCDHHHQLKRILDEEYQNGVINAWILARELYANPNDRIAIAMWDSALERARTTTSDLYSLGWLHAAYVSRVVLDPAPTK
jgi:hypothetical protein